MSAPIETAAASNSRLLISNIRESVPMNIVVICMLLLSALIFVVGGPGDMSLAVGLAVVPLGATLIRWLWRSARTGGSDQVARDAGAAAAVTYDKARSLAQSFKDGFNNK